MSYCGIPSFECIRLTASHVCIWFATGSWVIDLGRPNVETQEVIKYSISYANCSC